MRYAFRSAINGLAYFTADYAMVARFLTINGWEKQQYHWFVEAKTRSPNADHIEWWDRGNDAVLVFVSHEDGRTLGNIFGGLKAHAAYGLIGGKPRKAERGP